MAIMKIRAGKKLAILSIMDIVGEEELTTKQIHDKLSNGSSKKAELTFRQLTNVLSSYFDKAGYDNKTKCIIWKKRDDRQW